MVVSTLSLLHSSRMAVSLQSKVLWILSIVSLYLIVLGSFSS